VVVTWNVHVGAADFDGFVRRLRAGEFTDVTASRFVLLLQEVMRKGDEVPRSAAGGVRIPKGVGHATSVQRHDIVAVAARLGLALHYVPSMRNGTLPSANDDRGNAILSTESLADLAAIELPFGRQRRVAVAASIALPGRDCAPQVLRLASGRCATSSARCRLRRRWSLLATSTPGLALPTAPRGRWRRRCLTWGLDHVFSRPPAGWSVTARRLDARFGSDHYPILARVRRLIDQTAAVESLASGASGAVAAACAAYPLAVSRSR
jgi:endonuclease/exonuclease/phosphatase family metal-dependent hydrolase